jgi:hypothetical protein
MVGLVVDQGRVLDRAHAQRHRAAHRLRRMAVGGDVLAGARRLVDGGGDLLVGVLAAVERIGRRGDAARAHDLDVRGPAAQLLAHGAAHRVDAVGNDRKAVGMAGAAADVVVAQFGLARPQIAVAAGLADDPAAVEQSRSLDEALAQRPRQADIAPADVAQGGEAAIEAGAHEPRRIVGNVGLGRADHRREIDRGGVDVDVGVDQARHQHPAGAVDDIGTVAGDERLFRDLAHDAVGHEDVTTVSQRLRPAVEHPRAAKQHLGQILSPPPSGDLGLPATPPNENPQSAGPDILTAWTVRGLVQSWSIVVVPPDPGESVAETPGALCKAHGSSPRVWRSLWEGLPCRARQTHTPSPTTVRGGQGRNSRPWPWRSPSPWSAFTPGRRRRPGKTST